MPTPKILVVIDPMSDDQIALERATSLAIDTKTSLHLFCCTYLFDEELGEYSSRKDAKQSQLSETKIWLQELAAPIAAQGIAISHEVVWNQRWAQMAVQSASRCGASMIVKSSYLHSQMTRKFSKTSDFYLMRSAACPVMLVKSDINWQNRIILAAVCLDEAQPEHELLNNSIVTQAQRLARATGFELHLVSANSGRANFAALFGVGDDNAHPPLELVSQRFGVKPENIHLVDDKPKAAIVDTAQKIHADLLVIGTAARQGIKATLLGNTAEKVLDELEIDILTVS